MNGRSPWLAVALVGFGYGTTLLYFWFSGPYFLEKFDTFGRFMVAAVRLAL